MKLLAAAFALLASTSAFADTTETLCGRVNIETSDGLATVMVYELWVPMGDMLPAFQTFRIVAQGTDFGAINKASEIINGLQNGEQVCLEGTTFQDSQYQDFIIPSNRVR